jgi:hypothetical protein
MSGLPDPRVLQEYETIQRGFSRELLSMAQKEQRFRHLSTYIGQILGLIVALSFWQRPRTWCPLATTSQVVS